MKLRNVGLLIAMLAVASACDKSAKAPPAPAPGSNVAPVTAPGSAAVAQPAPVGSASPATDDPWSKPEAKKDPLAKPFFWSIAKDGKTSHILGTMHVGIDPHARLPEIVWKKLEESTTFAMETDLSKAGALDVLRNDGKTLRDDLGPTYWQKLVDALGEVDAERVSKFKPMIAATMLSLRGLPETAPMDGVLHGRALNLKKKIVFLETIEHEAAVLEKWMNVRALKDMLDDVKTLEDTSKRMLAAYGAGDEKQILALADEERVKFKKRGRPAKEYEDQMEDLLYRRNAAWIEPIEKLHADGRGFIAMGALHAIGERSVLELLAAKGYTVTRITP